MSKFKIAVLVISCLIMFGLVAYYSYTVIFPFNAEEEQMAEFRKERADSRKKMYEEKEQDEGMNSIHTPEETAQEFELDMPETAVQSAIHALSHQKVAAQDKWSHLQITPERNSRLIEVVEYNKDEYQHANLYFGILYSWRDGDFSNSVEAHNEIWSMQLGTIGKATRLLTEDEEKKYIEQHFK